MATEHSRIDLTSPWEDDETAGETVQSEPPASLGAEPPASVISLAGDTPLDLTSQPDDSSATQQTFAPLRRTQFGGQTISRQQSQLNQSQLNQSQLSQSQNSSREPADDDSHTRFSATDDAELSADSLIIARPKNPVFDRLLPAFIYGSFLGLLAFMFTAGLQIDTWQRVVTLFGEEAAASMDTFVTAPLSSETEPPRPELPEPELMVNPYYFLPTRTAADRWPVAAGDSAALYPTLRRYDESDGLGRYRLLRELRRTPNRAMAPIFTRALAEKKLWLVMEAVFGLIACGEPVSVFQLERKLESVSPALMARYIKRLSTESSPLQRVWLRTMIKTNLPWLRPMLMRRLPKTALDRLYLAAARFDKNAAVRRFSRSLGKDTKGIEAYKKVWYLDLEQMSDR